MTVSEAITKSGITPSASYTGIETANDFVLAFQIESTQTKESQWIVCADHVKEHSGSLNATTEDAQYIPATSPKIPAPSAPLPSTATAAWAMIFRILC